MRDDMVELLSHRTGGHLHNTWGNLADDVSAAPRRFSDAAERGRRRIEDTGRPVLRGPLGAPPPRVDHRPTWQLSDDELAAQIARRSTELGVRTPARRALESSLVIDEPLHQIALISRQPHPELLFGTRDWAGYLEARAFARRYGDQELTVPFITELHQRLSRFSMPPGWGGRFVSGRRWGLQERRFTDSEMAAIQANPYLDYLPPGTGPSVFGGVEYRLTSPEAIRTELQSTCDWFNTARSQPGADPYRLAAELQQRFISIHPFPDYDGRESRLLMNWALEREGLPPSALSDFNKDLFSTPEEWTDAVRTGSDAFKERSERLERLGDNADPVEIFGLEREQNSYRTIAGEPAQPTPGRRHDIEGYRDLMGQLRSPE